MDFVGSHKGLFIFAFSKAQPTPPGLSALGFLGDACSKQVLTWGKLSPGQSKGMGDVLPPLLWLPSSKQGFHGCFRIGYRRERANAFHCMGHRSWVSGLEQSCVVSIVTSASYSLLSDSSVNPDLMDGSLV